MSAMRMGVDLSYVFCTPSAAPVIKGYSPDLIVMPMLPATKPSLDDDGEHIAEAYEYHKKCLGFIDRLSVLIIGPGLGDDPQLEWPLEDILRWAREQNLPLIIDGSGLNFIATRLQLVKGYANCILTPNIAELGRLAEGAGVKLAGKIGGQWQQQAPELARALTGPLVLSKGGFDIITDGNTSLVVTADGSPRRCGGQGDILTGTIAAFISWQAAAAKRQHKQQQQQKEHQEEDQQQEQQEPQTPQQQERAKQHQQHKHKDPAATVAAPAARPAAADGKDGSDKIVPPLMLAAYAGCLSMRSAAVLTYKHKGRSMVAGDMIDALGDPVLQHCGLLPAAAAAAGEDTSGPATPGSATKL